MQKIYGKEGVQKLMLDNGIRMMGGMVDENNMLHIVIGDYTGEKHSFVTNSLHDIALLRDFLRRAERRLKDSVKIQK